ncbi:unnamed protein product [Calicophoron daubneyi]|uniref:Alpha-1,3/1,6-mannosyltransferase ALG2 n=1 Tax=Calicophoron daubneyi TaxID=300641 RepID=A0AAV2TGI3_CALDB
MYGRVVFLHPDLGIGGAERLVVDAAVAVNRSGYGVKIITNHHDPTHCFEETMRPELNVVTVCQWFPRSFLGRFRALFACIRLLIATIYLVCTCNARTDLIFLDQISAPLFLLRLFGFKTIFYCHFPDLLLTERRSILKKIYRWPIDYVEERSTGCADKILVNSNFTAGVFHTTFTSLKETRVEVVYPVSSLDNLKLPPAVLDVQDVSKCTGDKMLCRKALPTGTIPASSKFVFVSINRYERKKNISLAMFALNHLIHHWDELVEANSETERAKPSDVHLVIAGGYDTRVPENVEHYEELVKLAKELMIDNQVTFVRSCLSEMKSLLIAASDAVLYTPEGEHFGIVPVEAMFLSRPVVALDSGGPRETIVHGSTGFLCPTDPISLLPPSFASLLAHFIEDPSLSGRMGRAGYRRAVEKFSFEAFRKHMCDIIIQMYEDKKHNA